ncbi:MAG TPA: aminomethyltransferase family protein, partial [Chloroflexota bacterium]|nr:aminomethyltransferase family protein [Chloroflexota bacterium]
GIVTFRYFGGDERSERGKIRPEVLKQAQARIAALIATRCVGPDLPVGWPASVCPEPVVLDGWRLASLYGRRARAFVNEVVGADLWDLAPGDAAKTELYSADGTPIAPVVILRRSDDEFGRSHYLVGAPEDEFDDVVWWLKSFSSGLVLFDLADPWAKVDGPVAVTPLGSALSARESSLLRQAVAAPIHAPDLAKPYFVGQRALASRSKPVEKQRCELPTVPASVASPLQSRWPASTEPAPDDWPMPRSFGDADAELQAIRDGAGLVDKSGLGILELSGPDARRFLDLLTTNDVAFLAKGAAQYTFLLDDLGAFIADAILYRCADDRFWLTTAPSHTPRALTWIQEALSGRCRVDPETPSRALPNRVQVRDLRSAAHPESLVCVGLAGPNAPAALRAVAVGEDRRRVARVRKFTHVSLRLAGVPVTLARTTHTGSAHGYEIYVTAGEAVRLWEALVGIVEPKVQPVGWEAWSAAGIAAGLPRDGAELGGPFAISPVQAGYGELIALHKPFFVGRSALLARGFSTDVHIARFRLLNPENLKEVRSGTPVVSEEGICVGHVTSASPLGGEPFGLGLLLRAASTPGARLGLVDGAQLSRPARIGENLAGNRTLASGEVLPRFPK